MPGLCLVNDLLREALLERKKWEGETFIILAASVTGQKCLEGLYFLEGCFTDFVSLCFEP